MLIDNRLLTAIVITLTATAIALCCLLATLVLDALSFLIKEYRKKKVTNHRLEKRLEQEILSRQQQILERIATQTEEETAEMLSQLAETIAETIKEDYQENRQNLRKTTEKYLEETKVDLRGLVANAAKKIDGQLAEQLQTTQSELEDYKKKQTQKIDNQIAALVEKTIYKTLGKGLSREDHLDLIYKSLAEAKREEFFNYV